MILQKEPALLHPLVLNPVERSALVLGVAGLRSSRLEEAVVNRELQCVKLSVSEKACKFLGSMRSMGEFMI